MKRKTYWGSNATLYATALAVLVGVSSVINLGMKTAARRDAEAHAQFRTTCDTMNETMQALKGTNYFISTQAGQELLDYLGMEYQLGSNQTISLDISMADNWKGVYVFARGANGRDPLASGFAGFTNRTNLQAYLDSRLR